MQPLLILPACGFGVTRPALGEKHMSIMTANALYNLISQHPLHIVLYCYLIILTISFRINKNKWQFQMIFIKVRITPCT